VKRVLNCTWTFDTDETGWNTVWDISDDLNFYLAQKGLASTVFSDGEEKHPDIVMHIGRRVQVEQQPEPVKAPTVNQQQKNVKKVK